jgi:hypothetical protein
VVFCSAMLHLLPSGSRGAHPHPRPWHVPGRVGTPLRGWGRRTLRPRDALGVRRVRRPGPQHRGSGGAGPSPDLPELGTGPACDTTVRKNEQFAWICRATRGRARALCRTARWLVRAGCATSHLGWTSATGPTAAGGRVTGATTGSAATEPIPAPIPDPRRPGRPEGASARSSGRSRGATARARRWRRSRSARTPSARPGWRR